MNYQDINSETIDRWIEEGWEWGIPVSHEEFLAAKEGKLDILLTPVRFVPREWFGELKGKKVFGLASGGGQQIPVLTAHGAACTVLDYSQKQIDSELMVAAREGYTVNAIRGDMTKPLPFPDDSFDLIVHPVSNNYIKDVYPVFRECFRVLKKGGILLCGLDNGMNYLVDEAEKMIINCIPFNPLDDENQMKQLQEQDAAIQFSHTAEEQLGGQLKAGFILTDILEDTNGEGRLHELNIPSYYLTRAIKP